MFVRLSIYCKGNVIFFLLGINIFYFIELFYVFEMIWGYEFLFIVVYIGNCFVGKLLVVIWKSVCLFFFVIIK